MYPKLRHYLKYLRAKMPVDKYNAHIYWAKRGTNYFNEFQNLSHEDQLLYDTQADLIVKFLSNLHFNSVCEVGCGFGRITIRMLDAFNIAKENYLAFDLSLDQIQRAKELVGDRVEFMVLTLENIDIARQYELVLVSEVLMHIPEQTIRNAISKLVSLSSKYIVNIDWKETDPKKSSFFCFAHDYAQLYREHGLKVQILDLDDAAPKLSKKINQKICCAQKDE